MRCDELNSDHALQLHVGDVPSIHLDMSSQPYSYKGTQGEHPALTWQRYCLPCMTDVFSAQAGLGATKATAMTSNPARQDTAAQSLNPMLASSAVQQGLRCCLLLSQQSSDLCLVSSILFQIGLSLRRLGPRRDERRCSKCRH